MKISDITFDLPKELIVKKPNLNKNDNKMMVVNKRTGTIEHKMFRDIVEYLEKGDCIVANDSKVEPYMFNAKKEQKNSNEDSDITVVLIRELNSQDHMWSAEVDPARKMRQGNTITFYGGDDLSELKEDKFVLEAEVLDNTASKVRTLKFLSFKGTSKELKNILETIGFMPLPKEIRSSIANQKQVQDPCHRNYYTTVFGKQTGGNILPYAGRHFSAKILKQLELKGVNLSNVTLHIGVGTLNKIPLEDVSKYSMPVEKILVSESNAEIVNNSIDHGKKICAIGTSSLRAIENSTSVDNKVTPISGIINRFIYLESQINVCDMLLTNFHLPGTVPMVISSAFGGVDLMKEAYTKAIENNYKFFVYGDAILILK